MELTCIMCPVGCTLKVETKNNKTIVTGNSCPRGAEYGAKEVTCPERIVTTVKQYKTGTICLKTDKPVPKKLIDDCLRYIAKQQGPNKIKLGEVYISNILNTGSNIVVTEINL